MLLRAQDRDPLSIGVHGRLQLVTTGLHKALLDEGTPEGHGVFAVAAATARDEFAHLGFRPILLSRLIVHLLEFEQCLQRLQIVRTAHGFENAQRIAEQTLGFRRCALVEADRIG
jgi:hypothetical protein